LVMQKVMVVHLTWSVISNTLNHSELLDGIMAGTWAKCIFPNSLSLDLMNSFLYHSLCLHLESPWIWTKRFVCGIHDNQQIISKTNTNYLITMCNK
jgi:hypothetical protein